MSIRKLITAIIAASTLLLAQPLWAAATNALSNMAAILIHLSHYPSSAEKDQLTAITKDSSTSANERTIAQAIINLQHHATDADKEKLSKIMSDSKASGGEKKLATIVHNLSHMPSDADKAILKQLMH